MNDDIRDAIVEIEHAEILASNQDIDTESREAALRNFITRKSRDIVELLNELREWRSQSSSTDTNILEKRGRVIVEGFSDESAAAAFSDGLNKAAHYFSEMQDVSITLKQLTELQNGGHRAVLELHITPNTLKNHAHVKGLDIEYKKRRNKEFEEQGKAEAKHTRNVVFDHLITTMGGNPPAFLPEYMLINVKDADIMNYMMEKAFFKAGQDTIFRNQFEQVEEDEPAPLPSQVMVRTTTGLRPQPK